MVLEAFAGELVQKPHRPDFGYFVKSLALLHKFPVALLTSLRMAKSLMVRALSSYR
jgi:hypothetical protein